MARRHMKRCSTSLIIRKVQINTTRRYQLIPVRVTIIHKSTNKHWWGYRQKGTLVHCWWEWQLIQPLWKTVQSFLKKLEMELPFEQVIPLQKYILRFPKHQFKRACEPLCSQQHYLQQPRSGNSPSVRQWMSGEKKLWYIYTKEYYAAVKRRNSNLWQKHG